MIKRLATTVLIIAALVGTHEPAALALSTPNVPINDSVYRDIDKLVAMGYVMPGIIGQRPWARSEIARLVAQAITHRAEKRSPIHELEVTSYRDIAKEIARRRTIDKIIDRLEDRFHEELVNMRAIPGEEHALRIHPIERVDFELIGMRSPPTTIPVNNGLGFISANVNPFGEYDEGRHIVDGLQSSVETISRFGLTEYFSVLIRPRFELSVNRVTGDPGANALIQNAYGVVEVKNFAFEFGRDSVVWGVGQHGGNMLTNNARPLDSIRITNPHPARLPWVFRHLGQWRYMFFGANMGPSYSQKYAWLTGWKLSLLPSRWVELGIGHMAMMGGEGAPPLSALDVLGEFTGFRPSGASLTSPNKANQVFEAELLLRIPPLRGMQIYGILTNDDKRDSIKRFFKDGTSYLFGMYLPALGTCGKADFRVEYNRTCALCFRHTVFNDGFTLNDMLLGTNLGPDAEGVRAQFNYDLSDKLSVGGRFDWDHRRSNIYTTEIEPDGTLGDVILVEARPSEDRYRTLMWARWRKYGRFQIRGAFGYERVINYNFVRGVSRNNFMGSLILSLDLDSHTAFVAN